MNLLIGDAHKFNDVLKNFWVTCQTPSWSSSIITFNI